MNALEIIRLVLGTVFLFAGLMVFFIEIIGLFKMNYVLNRMHAGAMGDTMGLFLCFVGLCLYSGFNFTTAKMILVVIVFWIASPVTSHMTALLEFYTNRKVSKRLSFEGELETLEKNMEKEMKSE